MSAYDYHAVPLASEHHDAVAKIAMVSDETSEVSSPPQRYYIPPHAGSPRSTHRTGGISTISNGSNPSSYQRRQLIFNRCFQHVRTRAAKLPYVSLICRHPSSICLVVAVFLLIGMLLVTLAPKRPARTRLSTTGEADLFPQQIPERTPTVAEHRERTKIRPVAPLGEPGWKQLPSATVRASPADRKPQQRPVKELVLVEPQTTTVGADSVAETAEKRRFIKKMMKHAWDGYATYAFGWNEISPASKKPHSAGIFGSSTKLGATIVDALDTLWIMGMRSEFERGRLWSLQNLNFSNLVRSEFLSGRFGTKCTEMVHAFFGVSTTQDTDVSVFETNIRFMGGLLSAFSLSGDEGLLQKAYELGRSLLPAFRTPTGVPWALYNFKRNKGKNWSWTAGTGVLAEFGTLHLEFAYLSNVTGDPVFLDKVTRVRELLDRLEKPKGLYPNYLNIRTGNWGQLHTSVGALGDSFYEYLFKVWMWSNRTDATSKRMYDESMAAIERELVRTSAGNHVYFIQSRKGRPVHQMDHLACFMGGLYALSAPYAANASHYALRGAQIADTCHYTYAATKTGLGPESFHFQANQEGRAIRSQEKAYYLRPETFETYFVLWRMTRNPIYRKWGWDAVQAIEKYCRAEAGYAGLNDVDSPSPLQDDVQQSFFLAETLKYLYLLFVDESVGSNGARLSTAADDGGVDISLNDWVLNSEAHPLPIFGGKFFPNVSRYAHIRITMPPHADDAMATAAAPPPVVPPA